MSRRALAAWLIVAALHPRVANARHMTVRGTIVASGGWTDNARSLPSDMPGGGQSDELFDLQPGMYALFESPATMWQLAARMTASSYVHDAGARAYSGRVEWGGFFELSPSSTILLGAGATIGRFNSFTTLDGALGTGVVALPPSGVTYSAFAGQEQAAHDFSPAWRGLQGLEVNSFIPLDAATQPDSVSLDHHFGAERSWARDALGLELRNTYMHFSSLAAMPGVTARPEQSQLGEMATARWRHQLARDFTSELSAGGGVISRANDFGGAILLPVAGAVLRYSIEGGQAELVYAHTAVANVFVGQTFVSDAGTLRGGLPLARKARIGLAASVGASRGRAADTMNGTYGPAVTVLIADVALTWAVTDQLGLSLRWQVTDQRGGSAATQVVPSFTRDVVLVSLSGVYPGQQGGGLPYQSALRLREEREQDEREQRERDAAAGR
jgi:hypothetical protein